MITYLEDTNNDGVSIMVRESVIDTLELNCHGSKHCCSRDWYLHIFQIRYIYILEMLGHVMKERVTATKTMIVQDC